MKTLLPRCLAAAIAVVLFAGIAGAQSADAVPGLPVTSAPVEGIAAPSGTDAPTGIAASSMLGQWGTAVAMPSAKCYHGAAELDGAVYIFGGLGGNLRYDTQCYKYDLASGMWSGIASLPVQRGLPVVEAVGDKIYIIGGYSNTNPFTVQRPVLEYDPATDTYTEKANILMPVFGAGSFVHNGRIWVLGGGTSAFTTSNNGIQIYDPALDQWTFSLSLTPYASWGTGVTLAGSTVMYVGGVRYTGGQGLFGAWAYTGEISGDDITWTQIADYPSGSVMRHAAGSDGSKAYFAGGYNSGSMNNGPPSGITYCYDPAASLWTLKDMKPTPVYFGGTMIFDGTDKLYVFGGQDTYNTVTTAVETLDVNAEGGPVAFFEDSALDRWLKNGSSASARIRIRNNGSAALNWNATVDASAASWLSVGTASGVIPMGERGEVPLMLKSSAGNGTHSGTVTVTTNDPNNASADITITLHVQDEDVDTEIAVVLEEGTGTWCGYCPYGADSLKAMIADYPGRVFGISYHGGSTTEPMHTSHTDFWTDLVDLRGWPQGSVNRILFDGEAQIALNRGSWRQRVEEVLQNYRSPISLAVTDKSYDESSKEVEMTIEVFFHRDVNTPLRLNVAQLQDQMNYSQVFYPASGGSQRLYPYFHDHVLRQMKPGDAGEDLTQHATMTSQSTARIPMKFTSVDSTIGTSRFVIFIHESDGVDFGPILQATELHLADFVTDVAPLPAEAALRLHQNFPNPFNPVTTVHFDIPQRGPVTLLVTDALGRTVATLAEAVLDAGRHTRSFDARDLPSGTYFLTLRAGTDIRTRSMTLMR